MARKISILLIMSLASVQIQAVTIISLGQVCSVAGAMREHGLRKAAYPFDWIVSPFSALYNALNDDFEHFLQEDSLYLRSDGIGVLDYYGFHFVHDFPANQPNDAIAALIGENHVTGGILLGNWRNYVPAVREKYLKRIERLKDILSGTDKVFLIRHFDITQAQAINLRDLIHRKYPNLDFTLVVLGRSHEMGYDWSLKNIKNFHLNELDPNQWTVVFNELGFEPFENGMRSYEEDSHRW